MNTHRTLARAAALLVLVSLLAVGCATPDKDLAPTARARLAHTLKQDADRCLRDFVASAESEDGADVSLLESYVATHRRRTALFTSPSDSPSAFAFLGEALRMLGEYYRTLGLKQKQVAEDTDSESKAQELFRLSASNRKKAERHYKEALGQFNLHLRSAGPIDKSAYRRGFECASRLERYKVALEYLDAYERNVSLSQEEKKKVEGLRKWANSEYERRLRDKVRAELDG